MPYKNSKACKVCQSPYRGEIEELRTQQKKPLREITDHMQTKYGWDISTSAIFNHMNKHYEFITEAMKIAEISSKAMFKSNLIDAAERAEKLSGVMYAAYEYITSHFNELEMKTALQMLFGAVDQLNKMQGTGAFAPQEFLLQFQGLLEAIKRNQTTQPELIKVYEADTLGNATELNNDPENAENEAKIPETGTPAEAKIPETGTDPDSSHS